MTFNLPTNEAALLPPRFHDWARNNGPALAYEYETNRIDLTENGWDFESFVVEVFFARP